MSDAVSRFAEGTQVRVTEHSRRAYPRRIWSRVGTITGHTFYARTGIRRYQVRYAGLPSFDEDIREEHLESAEEVTT